MRCGLGQERFHLDNDLGKPTDRPGRDRESTRKGEKRGEGWEEEGGVEERQRGRGRRERRRRRRGGEERNGKERLA
jgi:hypothetical protein